MNEVEEEPPLQASERNRWNTGHSVHLDRRVRGSEVRARRLPDSVYWGRGGELDRLSLLQIIHLATGKPD